MRRVSGATLFAESRDANDSTASSNARDDYSFGRPFQDSAEDSAWRTCLRVLRELVFGKPGGFHDASTYHGGDSLGGALARTTATTRANRLMRAETIMMGSRQQQRMQPWIIRPDNRWLKFWKQILMLFGAWSAYITPLEFSFFNVPPLGLRIADNVINVFFLVEIVLTFFVAVKDKKHYTVVTSHKEIAIRYLTSWFAVELLAIVPWDFCYVAAGAGFNSWEQVFRWMTWVRVLRANRVMDFFKTLQRDIRLSYFAVRIAKLLMIELYITHVAGCIFYFLALTYPPDQEDLTWIGSLVMGDFAYTNFREIGLFTVYVTSVYWAIVTMATIGYGDIHPVNPREMVFAMIYISFDLVLSAYIVGNITALVVRGSNTTQFREKMGALIRYMNRNHLPHHLRHQMRQHLRLQFETEQVEDELLAEFPLSIRNKVSRALYWPILKDCYLFRGCSDDFMNQLVANAVPEYYFPQEVVILQRDAAEHMFVVAHGALEETSSQFGPPLEKQEGGEGGGEPAADQSALKAHTQATVLRPGSAFGEVALLCNIPQPYTVVATELCQVLRLDEGVMENVLAMHIVDGRRIVENMLQRSKQEGSRFAALSSDIQGLIAQQEAELTMTTIYAAWQGELDRLKDLVKAGASPSQGDYDRRTPLHLAAAGGFQEVVRFLVAAGADVNAKDNFGTTPLLEALRAGHDDTASLLLEQGASANLQDAGTDLCNAVIRRDTVLLQRLLRFGIAPTSVDYDLRTPLHIAAAEGFLEMSRILVEHGADITAKDRWGNTPLDEAQRCGSVPLVRYLEDALARRSIPRGTSQSGPAHVQAAAAAAVAGSTGDSSAAHAQAAEAAGSTGNSSAAHAQAAAAAAVSGSTGDSSAALAGGPSAWAFSNSARLQAPHAGPAHAQAAADVAAARAAGSDNAAPAGGASDPALGRAAHPAAQPASKLPESSTILAFGAIPVSEHSKAIQASDASAMSDSRAPHSSGLDASSPARTATVHTAPPLGAGPSLPRSAETTLDSAGGLIARASGDSAELPLLSRVASAATPGASSTESVGKLPARVSEDVAVPLLLRGDVSTAPAAASSREDAGGTAVEAPSLHEARTVHMAWGTGAEPLAEKEGSTVQVARGAETDALMEPDVGNEGRTVHIAKDAGTQSPMGAGSRNESRGVVPATAGAFAAVRTEADGAVDHARSTTGAVGDESVGAGAAGHARPTAASRGRVGAIVAAGSVENRTTARGTVGAASSAANAGELVQARAGGAVDRPLEQSHSPFQAMLDRAEPHGATASGGPGAVGRGTGATKRVTVYPWPPWRPSQPQIGQVMWVLGTLEDLLEEAASVFGVVGFTHVISSDGVDIYSVQMVSDNDRLYLATDSDFQEKES